MKIGILTQPLKINYGGILQAYALQTTLENMGYKVDVVNRVYPKKKRTLKQEFLDLVKKVLQRSLPVQEFIKRHIHLTSPLYSTAQLTDFCTTEQYDVYVVGSDQVWRPKYSPCQTNYYLDFTAGMKVKRVAYAASFGVDNWEYTPELTTLCKALLKHFDGVGVREASAVNLCNEHFSTEALHVLDPTMLLRQEDYNSLITPANSHAATGNLFCYILNKEDEKVRTIRHIAKRLTLQPFEIFMGSVRKVQESPTQWLRNFRDADMIITDSFHGTVFSIIYHKKFWVISNPQRGMTRLTSLLQMFGLEERLLDTTSTDDLDYSIPIDWSLVDIKLNAWRTKSLSFLENSLS